MKEIISTHRLDLVPLDAAEARAAAEGDRKMLTQLLGAQVPAEWPGPGLAEILGSLVAALEVNPAQEVWTRIVVLRSEAVVVGDAGFTGPPRAGTVELGYAIVPRYRRRGIATEAASALIAWALQRDEVTKVAARCAPENAGSVKVLEGLGMRTTGLVSGRDGATLLRWILDPAVDP